MIHKLAPESADTSSDPKLWTRVSAELWLAPFVDNQKEKLLDVLGIVPRHPINKTKKPKKGMLECAECSKKESIDTKQKCFSSSRCLVCQNQLAFIPQLPLDVAHRLKKDTENPKENSSQKKHNTAMPGTSSVYRDLLKQFNMICKYFFFQEKFLTFL